MISFFIFDYSQATGLILVLLLDENARVAL